MKFKSNLKAFLLIMIYQIIFSPLYGQLYLEDKSQHRFAQTYIGVNTQIIPSSGKLFWQGTEQPFPQFIAPRFTIGGLHFWGKLDFNVNFLLASLGNHSINQDGEVEFISGNDLSARYYPWRVEYNKIRPYLGYSVNVMNLSLGNERQGTRSDAFVTSSLIGGFSYAKNDWQLNAELMFLPKNKRTFYSAINQSHLFELPRSYFSIGIVRFFDATIKEEALMKSGQTATIEKRLTAKNKLNTFSLAVAPSSSFFIKSPEFSTDLQSLPRHKSNFNWDWGLGYLFNKAQIHIALSYRIYSSNSISYQLEHIARRRSIALEGFKFIGNYKGFAPYIGLSLSSERWAVGYFENDVLQGNVQRTSFISPGVILGWDIVPSPIDTWVLRTNLRYYPMQEINDVNNQKSRVDQFEFNFIQLVLYPNRMINVYKAKKTILN